MSLQSGAASLVALGVDAHSTLRPGVHLRWSVTPRHGFPPLGFDIFRRAHRPGSPKSLDFSGETPRTLSQLEQLGTTTWTTVDFPPRFVTRQTTQGAVTVLQPTRSALTCRFAPVDGLVRRVELDIVHWAATRPSSSPVPLTVWGTSVNERVTSGTVSLTFQNYQQVVTVAVTGDAVDGFQLWAGAFGILRVRWTLVNDEAELGWGNPLNPRRIGFPLTVSGYQVPHAYSPDAGQGEQDWQEAADRLRAGQPAGPGIPVSPQLAQRFGPPAFADVRALMREALRGAALASQPASSKDPRLSLGSVELTLLAAIDPDFARLLGLAMVEATAAPGQRYDYKVVAYWPGEPRWEWVCTDEGGSTPTTPEIPGTPTMPGGFVVTTAHLGRRTATRARLLTGLAVPPGVDLANVPGIALHDEDAPEVVGGEIAGGDEDLSLPRQPEPSSERMSVVVQLPAPTSRAEITARADGPESLAVIAIAGDRIVSVQTAPAGEAVTVTVSTPGTTSVVITGNNPTVTRICYLRISHIAVTEEWITFDVRLGPVPALEPPGPLSGRAMPGFAKDGSAEQVVGLTIEPPPAPRQAFDLLPIAKLPLDAIVYELVRRDDGNAPAGSPENGTWTAISVESGTGLPRPILRSEARPPAHKTPEGWPVESQDFIDGTLSPNVRYYSYRARGRDIFGRTSDWSQHVTIDAADRVGPPTPDIVEARWLDRGHPWIDADDAAVLDVRGVAEAVRLRWSWSPARQQQAPDARGFRVYWNERPFTTLQGMVTAIQTSGDAYLLTVQLPQLAGPPPMDAFVGDWLRQGTRQYFVRTSSSANPCVLTVSAAETPQPAPGACTLSLRGPDPQRLDLLGNPLRRDATAPTSWDRRYAEGLTVRHAGAAGQTSPGAAVTLQQVQVDAPRVGVSTVTLAPGWRWSVADVTGLELQVGNVSYPVLGGALGIAATILVDSSGQGAPPVGPATLVDAAGQLTTIDIPAPAANAGAPFSLVGGMLDMGQVTLDVLAHRTTGVTLELLVSAPAAAGAQVTWYPDYELPLTGLALPVSPAVPHATGVVGVSAIDGRPYVPDLRQVAGEPTSPGNEGPVTSISVERRYRGAPAASPTLTGAGQQAEVWAPVPNAFSGTSRFPLRWTPTAGASGYLVFHASLDAVLDADAADRAAARGAYAGTQPLAGAALAQWRQQQAALGPQDLQVLATAQPGAFVQLTPQPLAAGDPLLADPGTPGGLRWLVPLDGNAPGRHFLRVQSVDQAGNRGPMGAASLPIVVPDVRRPVPPRLRRVVEGDRSLWVVWDAPEPGLDFKIYRTQLTAGSQPDVRDMTFVATVQVTTAPEPTVVYGGEAQLPGATPDSLVAVYRAEDYDPTLAPGAQVATPVGGSLALTGSTITGLGSLSDGSLVFAVVRYALGGPATLAAAATACAYRDTGVSVGVPHQYRVVAERQAAITPQTSTPVRSFPSAVGEGTAYDPRPPAALAVTAAWNAAQQVVNVSWPVVGLPADLDVLVQRRLADGDQWVSASGWITAASGSFDDSGVSSGGAYVYRLRARNAFRRMSQNEPNAAPVTVP